MPTSLDSAAIRRLGTQWTQRSFFSAQTLLQDLLEGYKSDVEQMLSGMRSDGPGGPGTGPQLNVAKAREQAKELLQQLGYEPGADVRGTLQDLSSDARINLVLNTNKQMAQGEGWWLQGQDAAVLDEWPAQELFRAVDRKVERNWLARWKTAGEATGDPIGTGWTVTPGGKLVALKNHEIWSRIGDSALFSDGLGNPFPPFAFNSGMDVRDVTRDEAEALGLITAGETVQPVKSVLEAA